jgi:DNA primase
MLEAVIARAVENRHYLKDYLKSRNIRPETAERYGIGFMTGFPLLPEDSPEAIRFNKQEGFKKNRMVLPVYGASGRLTAIVTRSLDRKDYSFFDTDWGGIEAPILGMHQAIKGIDAERTMWLVEGMFDTYAVAQTMHDILLGWEPVNVGGLMTVNLSDPKRQQIKRYTDHVVLGLDHDRAGMKSMRELEETLRPDFKTVRTVTCDLHDWAEWNKKAPDRMYDTLCQILAF